MAFTALERMQLNNAVERVLHVTGNYSGGILEMAIVFDCCLAKDYLIGMGKDIADALKSHSKVFQNVRLNIIRWESDERLIKEVGAMPLLQMGRCMEDFNQVKAEKRVELLAGQLKKFYARSKLVLLVTDENYRIDDKNMLKNELQPFLYRRLILISNKKEGNREEQEETTILKIKMGIEMRNGEYYDKYHYI